MKGNGPSRENGESGIGRRRAKARTKANSQYSGKREALINAAADEFMEKGYEATAIGDIAARVGTDRATFYYYFESKEQLFEEIARDVTAANLKAAEEILVMEASPRERLSAVVAQLLASYVENYPHLYVYIQEELAKLPTKDSEWAVTMLQQIRRIESIVNEILREGVESGIFRADIPTEIAARGLFGMLNWTHRWLRPNDAFSAEQVSEWFTAIFLDGFVSGASGHEPGSPSGRG